MKADNQTLIVFGGTGDLAKKKLAPAFSVLRQRNKITSNSVIIGVGRKNYNHKTYKKFLEDSVDEKNLKKCINDTKVYYYRQDISEMNSLDGLVDLLREAEEGCACHRIFYLATGYNFFPGIVKEIKRVGLDKSPGKSSKIVFEKPFGDGLLSSNAIDTQIHKVFKEEQIYRIDHFLGKETVQNLYVLRFANPLIDNSFNSKCIEKIEVVVDEDFGVGNRLEYYDKAGVLKDMIQNHLLQVLSLLLINHRPKPPIQKTVHDEKIEVLRNLRVLPAKNHLLGQYKSYQKELEKAGFEPSKTETYARITLECNTPRFKGVKLVLRSGKMLERKYGQIIVTFKSLEKKTGLKGVIPNKIIIDIQPEQDIKIVLNSSVLGDPGKVQQANFDFCPVCLFGAYSSDAYINLIEDVIEGDKTRFTKQDELREQWRIIEDINKIKKQIPYKTYKDNTNPEK
ncbi:hypothetical protein GOV05_05660 [Candidatus Woesearchaeota archaeon]|nr:hypothetical protein [Candidatus Woesearchaeota archaeon]